MTCSLFNDFLLQFAGLMTIVLLYLGLGKPLKSIYILLFFCADLLAVLSIEGCYCPILLHTDGSFLLSGSDYYCDVMINTPRVLDHVKEG